MTRSLLSRRPWSELHDALRERGTILIGLDLDGTLAPLVDHPERASVLPRVLRLVEATARAPRTRVAIVSARTRAEIRRLLPVAGLHRVGLYGLEGASAPPVPRRASWRRGASRLARAATLAIAPVPGAWVERKGMTLAIHDREVLPARRAALARIVRRLGAAARRLGFRPIEGSRVVEFVPAGFDKGVALRGLIRAFRPETTLYFGDSSSDEPAFRVLGPHDFPVRVGPGPTGAPFRVGGPEDVARVLSAVVRIRLEAASTPRR
ncbi:MAG TPA: trehalose-phosphatase [Candidatus Eisenbacteria bacterium]